MIKLGRTFADNLIKENKLRKFTGDWYPEKEEKTISLLPFFLILIVFLSALIVRLFYLQVVRGKEYRQMSDTNRIRMVKIPAPRGIIYDRNKKPLVRNVPIYQLKDKKTGQLKIISREEFLLAESKGEEKEIIVRPTREYIYPTETSHLLGYIAEVTEDEINEFKKKPKCPVKDKNLMTETNDYDMGDFIGRGGIEESYECWLRGTDGKQIIESDTFGKVLRQIGKVEPIPGKNLNLSIDVNLQVIAEKEMVGKKGAVVCQDPQTGEILALYSSPSFDPNLFTKKILGENSTAIAKILNDKENQPLVNRAISGTYPSGSTFKLIVATAGLEDKKITQNTLLEDTGILTVGKWSFANWLYLKRGEKEGLINIVHAIKRSNDVFFYKLGEKIGVERINYWAKKFGLGKPLGIDLPGEEAGVIPNQKWKKENIGEDWYLGDTYHLSIGQGYLLVTPLQVNSWTAAIANSGKFWTPHLVKTQNCNSKIKNDTKCHPERSPALAGRVEGSPSEIKLTDLKLNRETIRLITEGMKQACQTGGTGYPLFDFKVTRSVIPSDRRESRDPVLTEKKSIPVACKTGTAEYGDPEKKTHAWFTAFVLPDGALAKSGATPIAVTVLFEGGGEGSDVAAPIAKKILEKWFEEKK